MRITEQLVDALTGTHLWAERFNGSLEDGSALRSRVRMTLCWRETDSNHRSLIEESSVGPYDSNGLEQPVVLGIVQVFERSREVVWECNSRRRRCTDRISLRATLMKRIGNSTRGPTMPKAVGPFSLAVCGIS